MPFEYIFELLPCDLILNVTDENTAVVVDHLIPLGPGDACVRGSPPCTISSPVSPIPPSVPTLTPISPAPISPTPPLISTPISASWPPPVSLVCWSVETKDGFWLKSLKDNIKYLQHQYMLTWAAFESFILCLSCNKWRYRTYYTFC